MSISKTGRMIYSILIVQVLLLITVHSEVKPAKIFSDHMVLQREQKIPVWGWAAPGTQILVTISDQAKHAVTGMDSLWQVSFDPLSAGGPFEMVIESGEQTITLNDILIGDVWLCSGQSNMDWPLERTLNGEYEVAQAQSEIIRMFKVKRSACPNPQKELADGVWLNCTPENSRDITAVGYFFAREIQVHIGVPVGIIHSARGGSRAEAWTEMSYLKREPELGSIVDRYEHALSMNIDQQTEEIEKYKAWSSASTYTDPGTRMIFPGWTDRELDHSGWSSMTLPGLWEGYGLDLDGSVWFRRSIEIPAGWQGTELSLNIGFVDDFDMCFFNGHKIGETNKQTRKTTYQKRQYTIPRELIEFDGSNVIAIRVFDSSRRGGIGGDPGDFYLCQLNDVDKKITLSGPWHYKIEHQLLTDPGEGPDEPVFPGWRHAPSNIFNAMIAPITKFALKGVIWYQGESNASHPEQYRVLFPAMISSWRNAWQRDDLPFYWVQLPNYKARQTEPFEGGWAWIRAAQSQATKLKYTGMAITTDVGEAGDIHPRDKQTVGYRLGLVARAGTYGQNIPANGPRFVSMVKSGDNVIVEFAGAEGGLGTSDKQPPSGFGIMNHNGKWYFAETIINDSRIILSHPDVSDPAAVCYNWADNPLGNLINLSGLPADGFYQTIDVQKK